MTVQDLALKLNGDLLNEYKHMLFYLHAANTVQGPERLWLKPWLDGQTEEELGHVRQFAHKIASLGVTPATPLQGVPDYPVNLMDSYSVISYAMLMEQEVVDNYHERRKEAESLYNETGRHYDLVVLLEEQIEHSQGDIDELRLMLGRPRQS